MLNPYSKLYKISNTIARLQTSQKEKADRLMPLLDKKVTMLRNKGYFFNLRCNKKTYPLPVNIEDADYFRPLFALSTHKKLPEVNADDTHAIDFDVPVGTDVIAIEDGIVTAIQHDSTAGGNDPEYAGMDNYLYVLHQESGLMFCYRHLAPFTGYTVNSRVKKGTVLGRVGLTGYVVTPHLHFALYVYRPGTRYILQSLKLRFC